MHLTAITPILNVSDVPASIAWFLKLGWSRCWSWNSGGMIAGDADSNSHGPATFAAVGSGECEIFLCRDRQGSRGHPLTQADLDRLPPGVAPDDDTPGVWMTWWVKTTAEVDAAWAVARQHGILVLCPPTDEPWGCRELRLQHPDGHTFRVSAHLRNG